MKQDNSNEILNDVTTKDYKYGFVTDIETDIIPTGLNEDIIRHISEKKKEPEWLLEFRLKAYAYWKTLEMPHWAHLNIPDIDYQAISYYAAPKTKEAPKSLDEVDPELRKTFDKLGISLEEQMKLSGIAVDAVMDSVSVRTTFREKLAELGVIFCSFSEAVQYSDNSIIAQLGVPDMRIPIQYALTYPARVPGVVPELDFTTLKLLTFDVADEETFRCLAACKKAIKKGGLGPCAANGANEEAVKLFLEDKIGFLDIGRLVEAVVDSDSFGGDYSLADVYECDRMARAFVRAHL